MTHYTPLLFLGVLVLHCAVAPPVTQNKKSKEGESKENEVHSENDIPDGFGVEYDRYLKEVVQALESDPQFREKLQKAEDADIRTGKIAQELEFVSHAVRSQLDEVKRAELERLRHYARKAYELQQGIDTEHLKIQPASPDHIDHSNPHTFEVEDLRRLIAKTTKDLAEADQKRREEFKNYEMQKEFERHEKMKNMTDEEKKKFESSIQEMEVKHKDHKPLHHPISKPQLEEVWEKADHMDNQDFDPKTFFHLHDLDGNGVWDADEVKALFLKELDKMYRSGAPEDDMKERSEEMERMREHVFSEADTNRDGLISYEEFLAQTQKPDFNSDPGWESLDQQQVYTPEEYSKFEMQRMHEVEAMIAQGHYPSEYGVHPQQGHPGQYQVHPQQAQYQGHPQQAQYQGHPQQAQFQGHPQQAQFQGHPQQAQFQGHPQQAQYQGHPQQTQFQGHHQQAQFQGHPQQAQFQGHPQQAQFQGHPQQAQFQGHPQQAQFQNHPQQGQFQAHHQGGNLQRGQEHQVSQQDQQIKNTHAENSIASMQQQEQQQQQHQKQQEHQQQPETVQSQQQHQQPSVAASANVNSAPNHQQQPIAPAAVSV